MAGKVATIDRLADFEFRDEMMEEELGRLSLFIRSDARLNTF